MGSQLLCPASPSLSGHIIAVWDGRKSLWLLPQTAMNPEHPILVSVFLLRKTKAFCLDEVMPFNPTPAFTPHGGVGAALFNIYYFLRMEIVLKCQNFQWDVPYLTVLSRLGFIADN